MERMKIQLIGHDSMWTEWATETLQSAGYTVTADDPDIIVVDAEHLTAVPKDTRFIVTYVFNAMDSIRRGFKAGAIDCIPKPYGKSELLLIIGNLENTK